MMGRPANVLKILLCATSFATMVSSVGCVRGNVLIYDVETELIEQTIDGFGASDAWSMQWCDELDNGLNEEIADLLFSREFDFDGNPKGIGLSVWRFNIGAGSFEQGEESQIKPLTRTECFLNPDGSYDWSRQKGQVAYMKMAKERGVERLHGFLNSPPVYFTSNRLATNTGRGGTLNLRKECYESFADFIATVVDSLYEVHGLRLDIVSPFNEPDGHWNWIGPKQEGSPAEKIEIACLTRLLDSVMTTKGLPTLISIPESSDYRCITSTRMTDHRRGYLLQSFFNPDSVDTYLGNIARLGRNMSGHSYWTNTPVDSMRYHRELLRDSMAKYGVGFCQTELCIMGNDEEIGGGKKYDRTMRTALYVARVIHHDLAHANAKTWEWWRAMGGDYKDGLLFRYYDEALERDTVVDSKLLWSFGNWSRFVRPGAKRIVVRNHVDGVEATDPYGVMLSAFVNADGGMVVVGVNYSDKPQYIELKVATETERPNEWCMYRTSDRPDENLKFIGTRKYGKRVELVPRSVTTLLEHAP